MRIGIEITPLNAALTGVGYYVRHLLEGLLAVSDRPDYIGFASGLRAPNTEGISIKYRRLPVPTRLLYSSWETTGRPRMDRLLGAVDVYHAVNYVLPPVAAARRVLSIHDLCFLRYPEWASPKIAAPFRRAVRKHARAADAIIACSEATKRDIVTMLDLPPDRIRVIYDAAAALFRPVARDIARQRIEDALGITDPFLLFVGTREPRKNLAGLLNAFARADLKRHLMVLVGGAGWNSEALKQQAATLGITDKVYFTGYIHDRALLPALYSVADAFVFPSWYEGFGLPVLEAMACGCPVITSNAASMPEVGGDAALYAAPEDTEAIAALMRQVTGNDALRHAMREKGFQQAQRFSWQRCAEETLACYRSLL